MRHDDVELGSRENYVDKLLFYMDELRKEITSNETIEEDPSIKFDVDGENDELDKKQTKYEPNERKPYDEKGKNDRDRDRDRDSGNDKDKRPKCHVPTIRVNCDLEVNFDNRNKIIYVCPDKLQYFTANAICCSGDKTIEIEYSGDNKVCVCGEAVISGCLGYYKIVKSGIIFIPRHKLSKFNNEWFPTDILRFRIKEKYDIYGKDDKYDKDHKDRNEKYDYEKHHEYDKHDKEKYEKCGKDDKHDKEKYDQYLEFDVVFTYSKCVDCSCKKSCKW